MTRLIILFPAALFASNIFSATAFAPPLRIISPLSASASTHTAVGVTTDSSTVTVTNANANVNFEDWIADAPNEITEWKPCSVEGTIPEYVQGTLLRNGGGIWSTDTEMFSHIFDGFAKIHAYRIHSSTVEHQARFLKGSWYKKFMNQNIKQQFPPSIGTGPILDRTNEQPKTGLWRTLLALVNTATIFDNTPVNVWDWTPQITNPRKKKVTALTDAPPRTTIDFDTMDTISSSTINSLARGCQGYELLITAHPLYSQTKSQTKSSVDTYNVAVELGLNGARINLVKETSEGERTVTASFASDDGKIPYLHSFGLSKNYAVIVLQPLRLDVSPEKIVELGFLRAMQHVDYTRVVVVELATEEIVLDKSIEDKVYFYHSISQAETITEGDDKNIDAVVSLRLCAYDTPDQLTGENQFMRLEQGRKGRELRNKMHKGGKFCEITCNMKDQSIKVKWNEKITQGFELPMTRYSRTYDGELPPSVHPQKQQSHPRYVYSFGSYALDSKDYDNWGLFKFDLEKDEIAEYYQHDSVYLSEPLFVADPDGSKEDDGVLLTQAYFGQEQETKLLVLDANNMKVMAEVSTGNRAPLDFHGTWIPSL